eukprot:1545500-Amphidinium_carterae.2
MGGWVFSRDATKSTDYELTRPAMSALSVIRDLIPKDDCLHPILDTLFRVRIFWRRLKHLVKCT